MYLIAKFNQNQTFGNLMLALIKIIDGFEIETSGVAMNLINWNLVMIM